MKTIFLGLFLAISYSGAALASDASINFAVSSLDVPILNPENGEASISMVFLEADLTIHSRSIALNGFLKSTDGFIWASYGTCQYGASSDLLYCAFNAENVTLYFTVAGPTYSGEITAVDNNGNVFDKGTATIVAL